MWPVCHCQNKDQYQTREDVPHLNTNMSLINLNYPHSHTSDSITVWKTAKTNEISYCVFKFVWKTRLDCVSSSHDCLHTWEPLSASCSGAQRLHIHRSGTGWVNCDRFVLSEAFSHVLVAKRIPLKTGCNKQKAVLTSLIFHRSFWRAFYSSCQNNGNKGLSCSFQAIARCQQSSARSSFINVHCHTNPHFRRFRSEWC